MKNFKSLLIFILFFFDVAESKRLMLCPRKKNWFDITSLKEVMQKHPELIYAKCFDTFSFNYKPFPFVQQQNMQSNQDMQPNEGFFNETFILRVPNGQVFSKYGWVLLGQYFIKELMWKEVEHHVYSIKKPSEKNFTYFPGRVAVITQVCYHNYCHWINEVLSRLSLLELSGIEYDWLYVPQDAAFMKDSLKLWGIDSNKIIFPTSEDFGIKADEIIVPSLISNTNFMHVFLCANYFQPHLLDYIINKFLKNISLYDQEFESIDNRYSDKIFLSRKDGSFRKVSNEDEVFELLEKVGFKRYELSKFSFIEQIKLFRNAKIIISPHASALTNIIFCKPDVKIVEIFQSHADCTFWYLSQLLNLCYIPIKTVEFPNSDYQKAWQTDTEISLKTIEDILSILELNHENQ